jgi:hypothetical protein
MNKRECQLKSETHWDFVFVCDRKLIIVQAKDLISHCLRNCEDVHWCTKKFNLVRQVDKNEAELSKDQWGDN